MNKLVVGLGNPGKKYINSRHNAGFRVLDYLADQWHANTFSSSRHADALTTEAMAAGEKVGLVKLQTFMNKSGVAVQALSDYFDVKPADILVIHDDIALPIGALRVSQGSTAGGHNGVQSVIDALGTNDFSRLRVGIESRQQDGNRAQQIDTRAYVLGQFSDKQKQVLQDLLPEAQTAIQKWVESGVEAAMNIANG
jgi:PTH1 family peptidyl-tRNA hydrolase